MIVDLINLITNKESSLTIDSDINIPESLIKESNIKKIDSLHLKANIKKIFDEYAFIGTITGNMILPDDLTLEDVSIPINIDFDEIFVENVQEDENNLIIIQNKLDIIPFLWQNIILEVPLKVIGDGKRNIKTAGDGWRLVTEEELESSHNSPFSNLEELINSRKEWYYGSTI